MWSPVCELGEKENDVMKIKTKKQLNLPQLIEWAMNNDARNKSFYGDRYCDEVHFDENKDMTCEYITLTEIFQVEVEEKITEDTTFKELICLDIVDDYDRYDNISISNIVTDNIKAIYIPNDDLTMTLIWRDGKLVE